MNLENNQSLHNLYNSTSRNLIASNDPFDHKNATTEMLLQGAAIAAEGKQMGLTADQTLNVALKRFNQNEVQNVEQRKMVQSGATNIADQSIFKESSKRSRRKG